MSLPSSEPFQPEDKSGLSAVRRRRRIRLSFQGASDETRTHLESIANLVTPSIDYYVGFLLTALLAGAAMLLDAPALYLLAALFTPFLGPVIGLPFSATVSSGRILISSLVHLVLGGGLVFGFGALTGWLADNFITPSGYQQIAFHSGMHWADIFVLIVGAGFTTFLLVRSPRQKPLVANIALAYELILPLAVSGFSLTNPEAGGWVSGINIFLIHLAIAAAGAVVLLFILGVRPKSVYGYAVSTMILALAGMAVWGIAGGGGKAQIPPEVGPMVQPLPTQGVIVEETATETPQPADTGQSSGTTFTATGELTPSQTPTPTVTYAPTPVWAKIDAPSGGGAYIREEPGGKIVSSLVNGSPVTIISEPIRIQGGAIWVKVRTESGVVGWILQSLLTTATPSPGW